MNFLAPIVALREIAAGETVGYNSTWRAKRSSVIATVSAGYADGYPRSARNGTPVLVNGKEAGLAGRVSMDMLTVDVTDLIACGETIRIGDTVELWGQRLSISRIAQEANTIPYVLMTSVSQRVKRVHSGSIAPVALEL